MKGWSPRMGAEMAAAFAVGAGWFALFTILLAPLHESWVVTIAVVVLDLVVVLAVAHYWDIPYAVTIGVASVVALDWYYIPPTHKAGIPDARNLLALVAYLLMAALLGGLAVRARRSAVLTEQARSALAGEQAALRRVATLVARETPPAEVFAAVTEEVGRLLKVDIATMLRYESDATATVVAAWSDAHQHVPVGHPRESRRGQRRGRWYGEPAGRRVDSYEHAVGSPGDHDAGVGASARAPAARSPSPDRVGRHGCRVRVRRPDRSRDRGSPRRVHRAGCDRGRQRAEQDRAHRLQGADRRGLRRGPKAHRARPA